MKLVLVACLALFLSNFPASVCAEVLIQKGTTAHFSSAAEGAGILGAKDDFIVRLSDFDRAARMKTDRQISEVDFLKFVTGNTREWTNEEKARVETALDGLRSALEKLPLRLPGAISFVKTTGAEEGNAFYTRGNAIILPQTELDRATGAALQKTIAHEIFHVLSRHNADLRESLYAVIGFEKCPEVQFPADLVGRKITNPDAPRNDHAIRLKVNGKDIVAVPILFSATEKYDTAKGGEFFNYLQFQFLPLEPSGPVPSSSSLLSPAAAGGFFEQVGRNTEYVIHPEEILAENFALLVLDQTNVPSPEIVERIRATLLKPKS